MVGSGCAPGELSSTPSLVFSFNFFYCFVFPASPFSPLHPSLILFSLVMRFYGLCDVAILVAGKAVSISSDIYIPPIPTGHGLWPSTLTFFSTLR